MYITDPCANDPRAIGSVADFFPVASCVSFRQRTAEDHLQSVLPSVAKQHFDMVGGQFVVVIARRDPGAHCQRESCVHRMAPCNHAAVLHMLGVDPPSAEVDEADPRVAHRANGPLGRRITCITHHEYLESVVRLGDGCCECSFGNQVTSIEGRDSNRDEWLRLALIGPAHVRVRCVRSRGVGRPRWFRDDLEPVRRAKSRHARAGLGYELDEAAHSSDPDHA